MASTIAVGVYVDYPYNGIGPTPDTVGLVTERRSGGAEWVVMPVETEPRSKVAKSYITSRLTIHAGRTHPADSVGGL